jgi:flagellar biosynthesis chaperone FliJ
MNIEYKTYDELNKQMVAEFRLEHPNLTDDELDKLVKRTFRINQATLRELDGVSDLILVGQ